MIANGLEHRWSGMNTAATRCCPRAGIAGEAPATTWRSVHGDDFVSGLLLDIEARARFTTGVFFVAMSCLWVPQQLICSREKFRHPPRRSRSRENPVARDHQPIRTATLIAAALLFTLHLSLPSFQFVVLTPSTRRPAISVGIRAIGITSTLVVRCSRFSDKIGCGRRSSSLCLGNHCFTDHALSRISRIIAPARFGIWALPSAARAFSIGV